MATGAPDADPFCILHSAFNLPLTPRAGFPLTVNSLPKIGDLKSAICHQAQRGEHACQRLDGQTWVAGAVERSLDWAAG